MKDTTINLFSSGLLSKAPVFDAENIHAQNHKNAIVMFSGGMDSTVSLWWALDNYENVEILIVDYNQPHAIEIDHAFNIAKMVDAKHQKLKVDFPTSFWGIENHLTRGQACLMTSLAALNISHDGADIVMGILSTDNYGDCDREFLDHIASVLFHPKRLGGHRNCNSITRVKKQIRRNCIGLSIWCSIKSKLDLSRSDWW